MLFSTIRCQLFMQPPPMVDPTPHLKHLAPLEVDMLRPRSSYAAFLAEKAEKASSSSSKARASTSAALLSFLNLGTRGGYLFCFTINDLRI